MKFRLFKRKNNELNIKYRILHRDEFDKLKILFPDTDEMWNKYRKMRMEQYKTKAIEIFVAEDKEKLIGELTINYRNQNLKTETLPNKRVYLEAFRVNKNYRGKNIGQKLLETALEHMKRMGYSEFTVGVEEDNKVAKHIYNKFGFTEPIDYGKGDEFDPVDYTLYLKK